MAKAQRIVDVEYPKYEFGVLVKIQEVLVDGSWVVRKIRTIHDDHINQVPCIVKKTWRDAL